MSGQATTKRRADPYLLTRTRAIPRTPRLAMAAQWANRLIAQAQELFETRHDAPCAECRLWEHYELSVTISHLIRPAGTTEAEWQDAILPMIKHHATGEHHGVMYREVFYGDAYETVPAILPCEAENHERQHITNGYMIRCVEHDLVLCSRHWNEHDKAVHGRQACEHLRTRVAELKAGP